MKWEPRINKDEIWHPQSKILNYGPDLGTGFVSSF